MAGPLTEAAVAAGTAAACGSAAVPVVALGAARCASTAGFANTVANWTAGIAACCCAATLAPVPVVLAAGRIAYDAVCAAAAGAGCPVAAVGPAKVLPAAAVAIRVFWPAAVAAAGATAPAASAAGLAVEAAAAAWPARWWTCAAAIDTAAEPLPAAAAATAGPLAATPLPAMLAGTADVALPAGCARAASLIPGTEAAACTGLPVKPVEAEELPAGVELLLLLGPLPMRAAARASASDVLLFASSASLASRELILANSPSMTDSQVSHLVAPDQIAYMCSGHSVQLPAPLPEKVPAWQGSHFVEFLAANVPAAQGVHCPELPIE